MINTLLVTPVQTDLFWEDKKKNKSELYNKLQALKGKTDLVILPEMFTTGFSMNAAHLAETNNGASVKWMQQVAAEINAVVMGTLIIKEKDQYYNRLYAAMPDGKTLHTYNKSHLFRMGKEHQTFAKGAQKIIFTYKSWRICPLICYDLRFPVWARNMLHTQSQAYDVLIYTANWPQVRTHAWSSLLVARAIENQAYVIGVNRIGNDNFNTAHIGKSCVLNYTGNALWQAPDNTPATPIIALHKDKLADYRQQFPAYLDADAFTII